MAGKITWVWKACAGCWQVLHRDEFEQQKGSNGKFYPRDWCPKCWPEANRARMRKFRADNPGYKAGMYSREYRKNNPELAEKQDVRKKCRVLGLDFDEVWPLWRAHDNKCDICGKPEWNAGRKNLSIDHDHTTGKLRGFLCNAHNRGLGLVGDTIESVESVLAYLRRTGSS